MENILTSLIIIITIKPYYYLEKESDITARKMSEQTGLSARKISHTMRELRESKVIILIGVSRKGYWEINKAKL